MSLASEVPNSDGTDQQDGASGLNYEEANAQQNDKEHIATSSVSEKMVNLQSQGKGKILYAFIPP